MVIAEDEIWLAPCCTRSCASVPQPNPRNHALQSRLNARSPNLDTERQHEEGRVGIHLDLIPAKKRGILLLSPAPMRACRESAATTVVAHAGIQKLPPLGSARHMHHSRRPRRIALSPMSRSRRPKPSATACGFEKRKETIGKLKTESEAKGRGDTRGATVVGWQAGSGKDGYPSELTAMMEKSHPEISTSGAEY